MDGLPSLSREAGHTEGALSGSSEPKGRMKIELLREWL